MFYRHQCYIWKGALAGNGHTEFSLEIGRNCYNLLKDLNRGVAWCHVTGIDNRSQRYRNRHDIEQQKALDTMTKKKIHLAQVGIPDYIHPLPSTAEPEKKKRKVTY